MGSNLGDRLDYLQGGLDGLFDTPRLVYLAVSPVYETTQVGGPEQPDYLNAVAIGGTTLPARAVLERCHSLEDAFGRVRGERWGPRTLDLDLIVYGDEVSDNPGLTLPHPRAHERQCVPVGLGRRVKGVRERREGHRCGRQHRERRHEPRPRRVEALGPVPQPSDRERNAQHEDAVREDRADEGRLNDLVEALPQGEDRDEELR